MKHQECSDCKHHKFEFESRSKWKKNWSTWHGIILHKDDTIRIAFEKSTSITVIKRVHSSGSEYEYRRTP